MYLKTVGKPSKTSLALCKEAVRFYGKRLISENLYHKLSVEICFEKFDSKNIDYAYCEWEDDNHLARDFTITINRNLSKRQTLIALAHEMVHVKQYAKGELKDYIKVNKSKWMGEIIDPEEVDYWEQPWEIEAHGREFGLYKKFIESLKD